MSVRSIVLLVLIGLLASCADKPIKPVTQYQLSERDYLYDIANWVFTGRLVFSDRNNSVAGSIKWVHSDEQDRIEVSGPLGVGRTIIGISGRDVTVNYGGELVRFDGSTDELVKKYTGVSVPVLSLKYWVLGLVDPKIAYVSNEEGFVQSGWKVDYQLMQLVVRDRLPKKMKVEQDDSKLKLIIDHWKL